MTRRDKVLRYDELKDAAVNIRQRLIKEGLIKAGDKIRKKPRDLEKKKLLFVRAKERLRRYPPHYNEKGFLVLPYFRDQN